MLTNICLRSYYPDDVAIFEEIKECDGTARPTLSEKDTTFGRGYLDYIWHQIEREGLDRVVFYDGIIRSAEELAEYLAPGRAWAYCFERRGEVLSLWWCNGHMGHMAQIHFCVFEAGRPYAHDMGVEAVRFIMHVRKGSLEESTENAENAENTADHSTAPVSVLCGMTPAPFRHAIRYAMGLGFQKVAALPRASYLASDALGGRGRGRYVDTVLTVLKREDLL